MLTINTKNMSYLKNSKCFAEEISILNHYYPEMANRFPQKFNLQSERTNAILQFTFTSYDKTPDNEIAGARYLSEDGRFTALIIND